MGVYELCYQTKMMDDRIFNMEKTGFAQKNKRIKVIAITGPKKTSGQKVWKRHFI